MVQIANWMKRAIDAHEDEAELAQIRAEVRALAASFPLPSDRNVLK